MSVPSWASSFSFFLLVSPLLTLSFPLLLLFPLPPFYHIIPLLVYSQTSPLSLFSPQAFNLFLFSLPLILFFLSFFIFLSSLVSSHPFFPLSSGFSNITESSLSLSEYLTFFLSLLTLFLQSLFLTFVYSQPGSCLFILFPSFRGVCPFLPPLASTLPFPFLPLLITFLLTSFLFSQAVSCLSILYSNNFMVSL